MRTSLIDAITLNRQNVEIYTRAYHPCRLLPHRKEDSAFQTPHKLCVPAGSVRSPPEACVLLIQRVYIAYKHPFVTQTALSKITVISILIPSRAGHVHIRYFVTTAPADVLAPNGARPSAGTMLTIKLDMSSFKLFWWSIVSFDQMTSSKMAYQRSRNLAAVRLLIRVFRLIWS